jgi:hypothetical protein
MYFIGLTVLLITVPGLETELLRTGRFGGPFMIAAFMLAVTAGVSIWSSLQPAEKDIGMEPEPERVGLMLQ